MEILVYSLVAVYYGVYQTQEPIVREPAEFKRFDLRALKPSYGAEEEFASSRHRTFVTEGRILKHADLR